MKSSTAILAAVVALIVGGCVFLMLPWERFWPGQWPYVVLEGRLDGQATLVPLDCVSGSGPTVDVRIRFDMETGTFRAAWPEMGPRGYLVGGPQGDYEMRLPRDKSLVLDPMGGRGEYELTVGNPYNPLSSPARRFMALCILGGLLLGGAVRLGVGRSKRLTRRLVSFKSKLDGFSRARIGFGAGLAVIASLSYSVVHELGHYLGASWWGVPIRRAVWTLFSGEEPHVEYAVQPVGWAKAAAAAGGTLLPSLFALVLIGIWYPLRKRSPWLGVALLVPAVVWLLANISGVIDGVRYLAGHHPGHMATFGEQLGLGPFGTAFVCTLPTLILLAVLVFLWRTMRRSESA